MAARKNQPPDPDQTRPSLHGLRCLVIDDEVLIAMDLEHILQSAGAVEVVCCGRTADALAAIASEPPFAVAIVDFDLGGANDMAVPTALRQRGIPFVFFTGINESDPRLRQFEAAPVVSKPYSVDELFAALRRALRKS